MIANVHVSALQVWGLRNKIILAALVTFVGWVGGIKRSRNKSHSTLERLTRVDKVS